MRTTKLPADQRKRLIRLIHVAKRQLGLEEEEYRTLLEVATGLDSCSKMSDAQLNAVYQAMQRCGFVATGGGPSHSPRSRDKRVKSPADKVRALWIELGKAKIVSGREDALQKWLNRMFGRDGVSWAKKDILLCLDSGQFRTAIEALKRMGERE